MKYTNQSNIDLPIALFLATDNYEHQEHIKNYISVTGLIKPIKSTILERTLPIQNEVDISALIASRLGTAYHSGLENAWNSEDLNKNLAALGYGEEFINKIRVNPSTSTNRDTFDIHQEIRSFKKVGKYTVGGQFDMCFDGQIRDLKTTKCYGYIKGSNTNNYVLQMSIYRWLNQDIITNDIGIIDFIFTDWSPMKALADSKYPQSQIISKPYSLMTLSETEQYVQNRLDSISRYSSLPQEDMPQCTKEELWQDDTTYAYYKDKTKTTRSTKNFDNLSDANARLHTDGSKGIVITRPGTVKRCNYCNAASVCTQKEQLVGQGLIK